MVEEVDLLCHADDWLRLFPAPGGVFAFTKSLLAFLEGDRSCSVTTLAETRKDLEFVSHLAFERRSRQQQFKAFSHYGPRCFMVFHGFSSCFDHFGGSFGSERARKTPGSHWI